MNQGSEFVVSLPAAADSPPDLSEPPQDSSEMPVAGGRVLVEDTSTVVGRHMMLVALTGWGQEEDKRRSREAGFDDHLVKPAEPSQLQHFLTVAHDRSASS